MITDSLRRRGAWGLVFVVENHITSTETVMVWSGWSRLVTRTLGLGKDVTPRPPPAGLSTSIGWLGCCRQLVNRCDTFHVTLFLYPCVRLAPVVQLQSCSVFRCSCARRMSTLRLRLQCTQHQSTVRPRLSFACVSVHLACADTCRRML